MANEIEEEEPEVNEKKRASGFICRLEPVDTKWIRQFPRSAKLIQKSGWLEFCNSLQGYHSQLTLAFIENYDEGRVPLKTLTVRVNEDFISEAIKVPAEGERWFKQKEIKEDFSEFLIPGDDKLDWKKGVHVNRVKPAWRVPLEVIQSYITCDGRYDRVLKCHLMLLLHIHGVVKINLPFYLFRSLEKMIFKVQKHPSHTVRSIYHQGLIKLLVLTQLKKEGRSWNAFLTELGFSENPKEKGKRMIDEAYQTNSAEIDHQEDDKEVQVIRELVNPETPCIKEDSEKLCDIVKGITSKKVACKQILQTDKPRTRLRKKLQKAKEEEKQEKEVMIIEDGFSEDTVNTIEDKQSENVEEYIDLQGIEGIIPDKFCTGEQDKSEDVSKLQNMYEGNEDVKEDEININTELNQCQRSLQVYKDQTKYLQEINEKLLVANKRLREDMEEKEAAFQKLLMVSRNILNEKKAMQQKLDQVKAQVKENDKDKEFSRLKRRSQIQPCSSLSNNGEITCHQGTC